MAGEARSCRLYPEIHYAIVKKHASVLDESYVIQKLASD